MAIALRWCHGSKLLWDGISDGQKKHDTSNAGIEGRLVLVVTAHGFAAAAFSSFLSGFLDILKKPIINSDCHEWRLSGSPGSCHEPWQYPFIGHIVTFTRSLMRSSSGFFSLSESCAVSGARTRLDLSAYPTAPTRGLHQGICLSSSR